MRTRRKRNKKYGALSKRLATYSLTAGAALMVGPQVARGDIIYSGPLGPQHGFGGDYGPLRIQMEGDMPEAYLDGGTEVGTGGLGGDVSHTGFWVQRHADNFNVATKSAVVGTGMGSGTAPGFIVAGNAGQLVGAAGTGGGTGGTMGGTMGGTGTGTVTDPGADLVPNASRGFFRIDSTAGDWDGDGESHYMGFSFELESDGSKVYGWAEIQRIDKQNGRLLGWAYDDSGAEIMIPEPGALALLALGAAGVVSWRRHKKT